MQQQQVKTENRIYFEEVPLRSPLKEQKSQEDLNQEVENLQINSQEVTKMQQLQKQFNIFNSLFSTIRDSTSSDSLTIDHMCKSISDYAVYIVKYQQEQAFFQHAVQKKFIALLLEKVYHYKFLSDVVKIVFSSLEFLLRGMKKEDQFVYFLVSINKEGFLTKKYQFEQDDSPYFANFLKLLTRKINQDEKYLNIFYNQKQPHFPLLLNLLRLHTQKDQILKTSVKLTLIELTSNQSKLIKSFTNNFPFVIFYPIYVYQIYHSFVDSLSDDLSVEQIGKENLKTTLRFMEDFILSKDKQAIEMYTNCFMSLVGRIVYKEFLQLNNNHKNSQRIIKILKVLHEIVVKDITVLKIKIGMGQLFTKQIGKNLQKFMKSKTHHMEFSYWLIDECESDIYQHCESIYTKTISEGKKSPSIRSSFLKTFNSYIPRSKDNWLYHQLKKISQLIGFQIELNKEIKQNQYLQGSYLKAIELDTKGTQIQNEIYQKLIKNDSQEILFYYFKLLTELKVPLKKQGIDVQEEDHESIVEMLGLLESVTSLSVMKSFYSLVLESEIYINENKSVKIKHIYEHVLERLIYFILTEGWTTFLNRSRISIKQQNESFSPDIFRDLQCDILFFVTLRHILGTKNSQCIKDNRQFSNRDIRRTQTKANCLFVRQCEDNTLIEQPIEIILDGQYIKLIDEEAKSISTEDILVNRSYIYESEQSKSLEIVQKEKSQSPSQKYFCVAFLEDPIKNYIWKEIKWRKQIVMELQLKLRLMMFEFSE